MREMTTYRGRRYLELAFMAVVTAVLLALVADQTHRGFDGLPSILVAAFAAGFGLEFVSSSWRDRLQDSRT